MKLVRCMWLLLLVFSELSIADSKSVDALIQKLPECINTKDYDSSDCDAAIRRESQASEQKLTYDKHRTPTEIGDVLLIERQPELSVGLNYVVSNLDKKRESKIGIEINRPMSREMFVVAYPEACNDKNQIDVVDNNKKFILLERLCTSYNNSNFNSEISYYLYEKIHHTLYQLHQMKGESFIQKPQLTFNNQGYYSFRITELDSNKKNIVVLYDFSIADSKLNNITCNKSLNDKCLIAQLDGPLLQNQFQSIPSNDRSFLKDITKPEGKPADNLEGRFNVLKFDKLVKGSRWRAQEANGLCGFVLKFSGVQELRKTVIFPECDNVTSTTYQLLSNNVLLANWQSERGGKVYLVSPTLKGFSFLELNYASGDDDSATAKVNGRVIYLSTSIDKIELLRTDSGELKFVKKVSKIK